MAPPVPSTSLSDVGGDVTIEDYGSAGSVDLSSLTGVGGDRWSADGLEAHIGDAWTPNIDPADWCPYPWVAFLDAGQMETVPLHVTVLCD